jgi:hypothetical protein
MAIKQTKPSLTHCFYFQVRNTNLKIEAVRNGGSLSLSLSLSKTFDGVLSTENPAGLSECNLSLFSAVLKHLYCGCVQYKMEKRNA